MKGKIMKYLTSMFFILIICTNLILPFPAINGELRIYFINAPSSWDLTVKIDAIGTVWDEDHYLSDEYEGGQKSYDESDSYHPSDFCWHDQGWEPVLGLGKYKISIYSGEFKRAYFYFDMRTSELPDSIVPGSGTIDVEFDYLIYAKEFRLRGDTENITGTTIEIWDLKSFIDLETTNLEPYPPDNFQLSSSGGHPYLTWDHSTNTGDYWTGYKIYREVRSTGLPNFTESDLIATVSASTAEYIDEDYQTGSGWTGYYCLKAVNGTSGSEYTDYLDIDLDAFQKYNDNTNVTDGDYFLQQNYPNPFNPSTKIKFRLRDDSFVSLKVYDLLGNEVETLLYKNLKAGVHEIQFNGSTLNSGIYFYKIVTDRFTDVKKLMLIK